MTPYNLAHGLYKARQADHTTIADPGDAGVINVSPTDLNVCIVTGGTTRTLQSADEVPVGVQVLVISQTTTIAVNSVDAADGEFILFVVTLDSAGARVWSVISSSALSVAALDFSTAPVDLGTVDINSGDAATDAAIIALADALAGFGLVEHVWT
jgi:hypothetical protein